MKILAIETSCDETAVAILSCEGDAASAQFRVLGNALLSQIDIHTEYGGVYPMLAKREHAKNVVPILASALKEAGMFAEGAQELPEERLTVLLEREPGLGEALIAFLRETAIPDIDAIAVTHGPGLEPALWVGVNFAKALAISWDKPLVGVNHLEGHIISGIARAEGEHLIVSPPRLPLLGLGIAGGHTDLVLMRTWLEYEIIGGTLDDSVGEAFDKVARMLDLPYPGGPQISKLAEEARAEGESGSFTLPRPMLRSGTCDFSFSGLKTAVLYALKKIPDISETQKKHMAREFEDAVADVLWAKTDKAIEDTGAKTLIVSGGVSANTHIRRVFEEKVHIEHSDVSFSIPPRELTTDNAIMIGMAGYFAYVRGVRADVEVLQADGNLSLAG